MNIESEVLQINLDDIIPNRFQPRIAFDEQGLKELSDSIKEHGIIQPLVLRKLGNKYEIIAGERRYKASTMAGLATVPAIISNIDDNKSAEVALVENVQRRDLSAIEEARSYKNLLDKGYLTQEQLAKKMGLSQSSVANKLRLLNLDDEVQHALMENKISERHARTLLKLDDKEKQKIWLRKVITERITVKQLEMELKKILDEEEQVPLTSPIPNIDDIKNNAKDIKSTNVRRSVESMMLPENMMTDYSVGLPNDVVLENKITEEKKDIVNEEAIVQENKFISFADSEVANMTNGLEEIANENFSAFNPQPIETIQSVAPVATQTTEVLETLDMMEPTPLTQPITGTQTVDYNQAVNTIKSITESLKNQGYKIVSNESNYENQYQINIVIEK